MDNEGPKWRLEHAINNRSTCQQASCKRNKVIIQTGELRIGTHTLFEKDEESRWYMAWRHWACATRHQIKGLKELTEDDSAKAPGFDKLSSESQEQVRLAFEAGKPVDKEFKDVRPDLAKNARRYTREYTEAEGYKVDICSRKTMCRGPACTEQNIKIAKGELRLGLSIPFDDGEGSSYVYKHWQCMSDWDLQAAQREYHKERFFIGLEELEDQHQQAVIDTLETGEIVMPPNNESDSPAPKVKKPRKKRAAAAAAADADISDEGYMPKKSKRRQASPGVDESLE